MGLVQNLNRLGWYVTGGVVFNRNSWSSNHAEKIHMNRTVAASAPTQKTNPSRPVKNRCWLRPALFSTVTWTPGVPAAEGEDADANASSGISTTCRRPLPSESDCGPVWMVTASGSPGPLSLTTRPSPRCTSMQVTRLVTTLPFSQTLTLQ